MVKNIGVILDSESIKGFGALGIEAIVCNEPENAGSTLKAVVEQESYAVILMTEEMFTAAEKELHKIAEEPVPAVIPIPGARANNGAGMKRLSAFVEQAVGSDILFKE